MIRYAHLQLPGGIKNLDNPDYELRPDSSAALHGTLMQVCVWRGGETERPRHEAEKETLCD